MGYEPVPAQLGADLGHQWDPGHPWELQITPAREKRFLQQFGDNNIGPKFGHNNRLVLAHRNMLLKIRIMLIGFLYFEIKHSKGEHFIM